MLTYIKVTTKKTFNSISFKNSENCIDTELKRDYNV